HQLPIAIYSWASRKNDDGSEIKRGAFYPFCDYSPEWQALQTAREIGARLEFIDLPWADVLDLETPAHRYAEPELRGSPYVAALCQKLGAPDLDALWDKLFEIEPLGAEVIWERCHRFCYGVRVSDAATPPDDLRREAFMAAQIERVLSETTGRILVLTGGFHSYALFARLNTLPFDHETEATLPDTEAKLCDTKVTYCDTEVKLCDTEVKLRDTEATYCDTEVKYCDTEATLCDTEVTLCDTEAELRCGLALTPYSYERLDALTGYEAGMQSPGFYDAVWRAREAGEAREIHRDLLAQTVKSLRRRKQIASSADLIAALSTARALASLRGHGEVWRRDLVDGILGALVKDELESGGTHPFLDAVHEALRGRARGKIASDAPRAPLLADIEALLREFDLEVAAGERDVELPLSEPRELGRSRVLHRLQGLGIAGFERVGGSDFSARSDLARASEVWRLKWTPETVANATEASIYGADLEGAARSKLLERAAQIERDADAGALVLLDAALMGLGDLTGDLLARLTQIVRDEGDFFRISGALDHLLYLFHFDATLGTTGLAGIGTALRESWERGVWLLETLGNPTGRDAELIDGVGALVRVLERCGEALNLDREALCATFARIGASSGHGALSRGAATGALWTLGAIGDDAALWSLPAFAAPAQLGDFLTGLFALAREVAQRRPDLVREIDRLLSGFDDERFLEALPALRLAFSFFTPREKHHMALTLMEGEAQPLPDLVVGVETAMRALEVENRVFETLRKYGVRPFSQKEL
ncbi:MAG TPA: DUF5682 family protein, partial [Abditibacterium sp.]